MIAFLVGVLLSVVAAAPALLLMYGGRQADLKQRLKLWGLGILIRFGIIGAGLYYLFTQTAVDRVPAVIGVALTYFAIFLFETKTALRS